MLEALRPNLIVTQTLCQVCAVAEDEVRAAACGLPGKPEVLNLEPERLEDVLRAIREVGWATGATRVADAFVASLEARVERVAEGGARIRERPRVLLLEWLDPPFSSGHWNPQLVRVAGGIEVLGARGRTVANGLVGGGDRLRPRGGDRVMLRVRSRAHRSRSSHPRVRSRVGPDAGGEIGTRLLGGRIPVLQPARNRGSWTAWRFSPTPCTRRCTRHPRPGPGRSDGSLPPPGCAGRAATGETSRPGGEPLRLVSALSRRSGLSEVSRAPGHALFGIRAHGLSAPGPLLCGTALPRQIPAGQGTRGPKTALSASLRR